MLPPDITSSRVSGFCPIPIFKVASALLESARSAVILVETAWTLISAKTTRTLISAKTTRTLFTLETTGPVLTRTAIHAPLKVLVTLIQALLECTFLLEATLLSHLPAFFIALYLTTFGTHLIIASAEHLILPQLTLEATIIEGNLQ